MENSLPTQRIRDGLAGWYHTRRRQLPWREEPTPYRVWVSEIMLQQTQVQTVIPYFERFIAAFPSIASLAAAPEDAVLKLWSGLGYYRRCRNLHTAAKLVVAAHGGRLPATVAALQGLPGIGRYTAGAIASIAFGVCAPLLDGNVSRVLARLVALELPINETAGSRALWELADELVDPHDPSSHNQALMELGALVCSPHRPSCERCPLRDDCQAHRHGLTATIPVKRKKARAKEVRAVCGLATRRADRAVLLARRPEDVLLGGLWELPGGDLSAPRAPAKEALRHHFEDRLELIIDVGNHLATVSHVFTHRKLTLDVYGVSTVAATPPALNWYVDWRWVAADAFDSVPLSRLTEKVLQTVGHAL